MYSAGGQGGQEPGIKGRGKCTGGGSRGGRKWEKKEKNMQYCAIFCN